MILVPHLEGYVVSRTLQWHQVFINCKRKVWLLCSFYVCNYYLKNISEFPKWLLLIAEIDSTTDVETKIFLYST